MSARKRDGPGPVRRTAGTRARRAGLIVGVLLAATALTWAFGSLDRPSLLGEVVSGALGGTAGVAEEARGASEEAALPWGFADEVVAATGRDEVRVDERARVVGFCVASAAEEAFSSLADELTGSGWARIESGSATCGSFSKGAGAYRWVFVSCVQVGDSTSVVVQYAAADEGS